MSILIRLLIIMLLSASGSNAQNSWVQVGAEWHYDFTLAGGWHYEHMMVDRDTIILGKICQVLHIDYYEPNYFTNTLEKFSSREEFVYGDQDTLWWFHSNTFHILYNFNASVGDSWDPGGGEGFLMSSPMTVSRIDTVIIDGQSLRKFTLSPDSISHHVLVDVVERIGSLSYFFPELIADTLITDYIVKDMHCYSDSDFTTGDLGSNNWPHACDAHLYIGNKEEPSRRALVYPNPVSSRLFIEGLSFDRADIYSSIGIKIKNLDFSEYIDVSDFKTGIYFIQFFKEGSAIASHRFVKK